MYTHRYMSIPRKNSSNASSMSDLVCQYFFSAVSIGTYILKSVVDIPSIIYVLLYVVIYFNKDTKNTYKQHDQNV